MTIQTDRTLFHARSRPPQLAAASLGAALGAVLMAFALTHDSDARAQQPDMRIVAAGGVITEILYALGGQDRLVGVDATSQHPPQALMDKPNVGYVRQLSAEGVLSLRPTKIIAIDSAGPPDVLKLVGEAAVPIETIPEDFSPSGVSARIRAVGAAAGLGPKAEQLADATDARFRQLEVLRSQITQPKRVLFVLALREGRAMVGGRNNGADAIIKLAGGVNAASAIEGYKPMSDEAIIEAAPDLILMMNRGAHAVSADEVFRAPSFSVTPAAAKKALLVMDGLYLLGFGPRTPDAARDLMAGLNPDLTIPELAAIRP